MKDTDTIDVEVGFLKKVIAIIRDVEEDVDLLVDLENGSDSTAPTMDDIAADARSTKKKINNAIKLLEFIAFLDEEEKTKNE